MVEIFGYSSVKHMFAVFKMQENDKNMIEAITFSDDATLRTSGTGEIYPETNCVSATQHRITNSHSMGKSSNISQKARCRNTRTKENNAEKVPMRKICKNYDAIGAKDNTGGNNNISTRKG